MIEYTFLERRFDQLCEDNYFQGEYMVDSLLNNNTREFKRLNPPNQMVDDICLELWQVNDDIPF